MEEPHESETDEDMWSEDSYPISTSEIYGNEIGLLRWPDSKPWKALSDDLLQDLEDALQTALLNNSEPSLSESPAYHDELISKMKKLQDEKIDAFRQWYFVVSYSIPLKEKERPYHVKWGEDKYQYLFHYSNSVTITRKLIAEQKIDADDFDLLLAFALRQCDLMRVDSFLHYHAKENFDADYYSFCRYIKQLERKFAQGLFTPELSDSLSDWIKINERTSPSREKIKTSLSVDKLAYLFKALFEAKLIDDNTKTRIIRVITESFESKEKKDIAENSFASKFHSPQYEAIEFWIYQFGKLIEQAKKDKEENLR